MAKTVKVFRCSSCGNEISRWMGKCPACQEFGTLEETISEELQETTSRAGLKSTQAITPVKKATTISKLNKTPVKRTPTGIGELDRVLGGGFVDAEVVLFAGQPGAGKALAASTLIPTPDGMKPLAEIQVNDMIFDGDGTPTKVLHKFHPNVKKAYLITFNNEKTVKACEDHLWLLDSVNENEKTYTTNELFKKFHKDPKRFPNTFYVKSKATKTADLSLPLSPYILGFWLGLRNKEFTSLPQNEIAPLKSLIEEFSLETKKRIPELYLNAGLEQRQELLRGLMDACGRVNTNIYAQRTTSGKVGLTLPSATLLPSVQRLISSLGCPLTFLYLSALDPKIKGTSRNCSLNFTPNFLCFKMPSKVDKLKASLKFAEFSQETKVFLQSIEEINVDEEYYCLMVESPLHTFLCTDGFIATHNSTLSLEVANKFALLGKKVLYSSGEESEQQIGLRAARMNVTSENIKIVNETNLETLLGHLDELSPDFLIVDSLQTLASSGIPGSIGSIQQSREAAHTLTRLAKTRGISMLLISQVIKNGDFSGSEAIQHIVDAALMLESDNDTPLKFLRASKNRFGDTSEVGVFQHGEHGLEEVNDPSGIFIESNGTSATGASCSFSSEGVRQIPVEIQALVSRSTLPQPRKQFNGINFQRGQIVCAILDKFCNAKLYEHDVFISTVSGIKVQDPQADLSIAASILSSANEKPIPAEMAFVGELSLTGTVRGAFLVNQKIKEAARLGFTKIIIPETAGKNLVNVPKSITVIKIKTVKELLAILNPSRK